MGQRNQVPTARVSERDLALLRFLAEHRIVGVDHVRRFLGVATSTASGRLRALRHAGYVRSAVIFQGHPACHQIRGPGLRLIDSSLRPPRVDLRGYGHDLGVAWLWLAARDGAFGRLRSFTGERSIRSLDRPGHRSDPPLAARLGGAGPRGGERLHYPDLLLVTARGNRVAVELELTGKSATRREQILAGYGGDPHIDAVLYLVESRAVGNAVLASARRLGLASLVRVQQVVIAGVTGELGRDRVAERGHGRRPVRGMAR
jgi:hypothetical protein